MGMIGVPEITLIVPMLCVVTPLRTLRVRPCDAERHGMHAHRSDGHDQC